MINNLVNFNKKRTNQQVKDFLKPNKIIKKRIKTRVLRFASCTVMLPIRNKNGK